jgi:hypothetical protein
MNGRPSHLGGVAVTVAAIAGVLALQGCKRWEDKMEAGRQELLAAATPCPPPAACTGTMTVSQRQVSTCSAPPAGGVYAVGDIVIIKDLAGISTLARVSRRDGSDYEVTFAEGITNTRQGAQFIGRVCR